MSRIKYDFTKVSVPPPEKEPALYEQSLRYAENNYKTAEIYYSRLQKQFENFMQQQRNNAQKTLYASLVDEFNAAVTAQPLEDIPSQKQMDELSSAIGQYAQELLVSTPHLSSVIQMQVSKSRTKIDNVNYLRNNAKRIQLLTDSYLDSKATKDRLYELYRQALSKNSNELQNTHMTTQGSYGFLRRHLIAQVVEQQDAMKNAIKLSVAGYAKLFRGEMKVLLGETAINSYKADIAVQVGHITGANKKATSYDILIGDNVKNASNKQLSTLLQNLQTLDKTIVVDSGLLSRSLNDNQTFGIQSKSWAMPKKGISKEQMRDKFYEIGERTLLHKSLGFNQGSQTEGVSFQRGWHSSAAKLSRYIIQILGGANVMYFTGGNQFVWTKDLIATFRQARYYLTFYYPRKTSSTREYLYHYPSTAEVAWRQQMIKNTYKRRKI